MKKITPVILCGGVGTRLWPLSRAGFPKQFLCINESASLFQKTVKRIMSLKYPEYEINSPIIVTGEEYRFLVLEQLREIDIEPRALILEPVSRNTAAALTLAALLVLDKIAEEESVLVVLPADQVINKDDLFLLAVKNAIDEANNSAFVTLGIKPSRPETGYGYIKIKDEIKNNNKICCNVVNFVEKPNIDDAQKYVDDGLYFWNSGVYILRATNWIEALKEFSLDIYQKTLLAWRFRRCDSVFVRPGASDFLNIRSESIDYAVMEYCPGSKFQMKMIPLDSGWSDLGSWDSIWEFLPKDNNKNASVGDVLTVNSENSLVYSTSRLVTLVGAKNLIVVETPDAVLVINKGNSQDVKNIVEELEKNKREEKNSNRKVHRPWGWYDSVDEGERFKVKRILVNPKASLSLQKHLHRAEHWIVVKGTAEVTNGNDKNILGENQSTYIPLGATHRLSNPGDTPLEIIEVQSGLYLGEDDIIRIEDNYGRNNNE